MKNKFSSFLTQKGRWLTVILFLLTFSIGQMWGQDVTLADINYTQWDGTAMPANSGLSNSNTYYASNGTSRVATLVGKGCKLDDSSNQPTATGVSGSYEHYLRFGSSGNYLNITASNDLVKNAGETSYGKVRFLVSSQKNKTTDELAEVKIGETSLGKIYAFTSTSTCDWVEFDIPATVSKNATITLTRTTNTLFVWGIQIKTFTSSSSPVSVTGITLAPSSATIKVGKTVTLVPTITPSDATDKAVTWAVTSGSSYASVTDAGVVTGLAAGTAVVTATAHDGSGVTQTATITVEDCPTSGTLFSMTITDPDGTVYTDVTNAAPQLIGATYVGGKAYATSTSSSKRSPKITGDEFDFNVSSSSSVAVKVELDCPLAEGDIISFTSTHTKEFKIQKVAGTNLHQTSSLSLAIPSGSSLIDEDVFYVLCANSACSFSEINIIRPIYRTITLEYADGETPDGSLEVVDGTAATKPADPTWEHHRFDGWYDGSDPYDWSETVGGDLTLTAHWTQLYTVTYAAGDAGATGDAPTQADKAATETFKVAANTFELAGKVFDHWNDGSADYNPNDTYTVGTSNVTLTAVWRTPSTMYAITKGTHANGDFTIDPATQEAGGTVTLSATPAEDYLFSAWEVVKTEDASATGITVDANGQFEMPAYAVTVNATFVADTRAKILYVTSASTENDKLYAALKDDYNVKVVGPTSTETVTSYALVVLHESVTGSNYNATAVAAAKGGAVPVLNTKSYFYNNANTDNQRWNWGTPNAGKKTKGVHVNTGYCNITSHPLFNDLTPDENDSIIILSSINSDNKPIQPIGTFTTGKEGYTLANVPDGCAIHELTPAQRGVASGKYLLISVYNKDLNNLNANGQKLFQNAAAYLIGSASWTPVVAPSAAAVEATPSENYTEGNTITLTASATGTSASTTYTWYKGDNWAAASAAPAVQAAATAAADGNVFTKTAAVEDAGTYWCNISNGAGCDAQASVTITVSSASTPTHTITYDNVKGATMTGYPTEYTEGIGVASFDPLSDITGWHFVGWSPASIATTETTDQTITAVWAQVFEVSFNGNGHGDPIAAQIVVDGELATDPGDPSEIGYDFGGWFTDAECTAGNEFDFATPITATTPLFAKWTAFAGCVLLVPATSGEALAVGDEISMQSGSKGGKMHVVGTPLSYNAYGLSFESSSSAKAKVTINSEIQEGTVISLTLVANGTSSPRGLHLYTGDGATKIESLGWTSDMTKYDEAIFTYTVQSTDVALIGSNEFQLWRNGSVFLKQLAVTSCGDPIIFHDLTSAILPDNDPAYATVTLGASSVREGHTTTATYSDINAAYEFDEWQISGAGASIADASANPAVITMGTADAVVTLKLKAATPKHTVTFNKMGKGADIASQEVKEGDLVEEPTVAEPEGWILEGWYKESTLENKWDFASDVMSTSDIELFAKWVADTSIKLINKSTGAINTTNFTTGVTATEANSEKAAAWGGTQGAISGTNAMGKIVQYNATTNQMKIKISAYNTNGNGKEIYIHRILEGEDTEQAVETLAVASNTPVESEYYTFNNTKNRSFYLTTNSTDVKLLQVRVIDDGTAIKQAGQAGYSVNLNKGRVVAYSGTAINFEGLSLTTSSNYGVISSTELQTKANVAFTVTSAVTMSVTTNAAKYYVSQNAAEDGTTATAVTTAGTESFDLTAGTWYIVPSTTSAVKITNISFVAPKCEKPTITTQPATNVTFGAGNLTATVVAEVSDGGTLSYQWYNASDDSEVTGADEATLTTTTEGTYYVIVTNTLADHSDNFIKSDNATLGYRTLNDATLSALSYGDPETAIALEADKYEYRVILNEGTVDVPALHATATMNPYPTVTITDAASFTDYTAQSTVHVTAEDGVTELTYTVNFIVKHIYTSLEDVTASTTWNWTGSVDQTIDDVPNKGVIIANYIEGDNFEKIEGKAGEYARRTQNGGVYQGTYLHFNTTVPGRVKFYFRAPSGSENCTITVKNGGRTVVAGTRPNSFGWSNEVFVNGDVVVEMVNDKEGGGTTRVQQVVFTAADPDYTRPVTEGRYGTICLPNGGVMVGAAIFEIAYFDVPSSKIYFDEILNGQMVAGTPYIFLPNESGTLGVYYTDAANAPAGDNNGLYGSYTEQVLDTDGSNYILLNNQYCRVVNANTRVGANRAYIKLAEVPDYPTSAPLPGRRRVSMSVQGVQAPTGLDELNAGDVPVKVMINGELFILRGEKMYDATGRLVK